MLTEPAVVDLTKARVWCPRCKGHIFYDPSEVSSKAWESQDTGVVRIFPTIVCSTCQSWIRLPSRK